jgi:ribosomal protein S18 acetylase RimI-like enzyme
VGYRDDVPVATAASVVSDGVIGIYNVATIPERRGCGYAEAVTRHAIDIACAETGIHRIVIQSTTQGLPLYERMGFRAVTRILAYNSTR